MRRAFDVLLTLLCANRYVFTAFLTLLFAGVPIWWAVRGRLPAADMPKEKKTVTTTDPLVSPVRPPGNWVAVYDSTLVMPILTAPSYLSVPFALREGDELTVSAKGTVQWLDVMDRGQRRTVSSPPSGSNLTAASIQGTVISRKLVRIYDKPLGSLIGAIGKLSYRAHIPRVVGTQHFYIGSRSTFTAPRRGQLHLTVNDSFDPKEWRDNSGSWDVHVTVRRQGKNLDAVPARSHDAIEAADTREVLWQRIKAEQAAAGAGRIATPHARKEDTEWEVDGTPSSAHRKTAFLNDPLPTMGPYRGRAPMVIHPFDQQSPAFIEQTYYLPRAVPALLTATFASVPRVMYTWDCCEDRNDFLARFIVRDERGRRHVLFERVVNENDGWVDATVSLERFRGGKVNVRFEAAAGGAKPWCCEYAGVVVFYAYYDFDSASAGQEASSLP